MKGIIETRLAGLLKAGVSAAVMVCAQTAYAQAEQPAAPAAAENSADAGTTDIIVTATKRSERLQNVPVSVVVVNAATLAQSGTISTTQLPSLAPGLSFGTAGQPKLTSFYIRGVGTYALGPTLESSVGVAIDGVPIARVGGSIADMVDVDHIEVLKGPQGTLFGKNATAGLISIVNKKPVIGENSFTGHLSYGSYNELNVDATVNLALGDTGALRLTAWRAGHDGITRDQFGHKYDDANSYGVRVGFAVQATEALKLSLTGQFDGRDQKGSLLIYRAYSPLTPPALIAYENSLGITASPHNRVGDISQKPTIFGKNTSITGQADLDLGNGFSLTGVTSYRSVYDASAYDTFGTSSPFIKIPQLYQTDNYDQFTTEIRVASPADKPLSFVAGVFYYDFHIKDFTQFEFFGVPTPGVSDFTRKAVVTDYMRDYAVFGDVTYKITPGIRILGGIRQSHDRTGGSFDRTRVGVDTPPLTPLASVFSFTPKSTSYNFTSYRVGIQADLARDVMLYATTSRGYKGPGFNLTSALTQVQTGLNDTRVNAETARSIEGGIKSQFFNRRLTVNITGFHSVFKDFQTTVSQPSVPGSFVIQNAGEIKSDGVEFEILARPVNQLTLGFRGAYINSRFTDYTNSPCYVNQPTKPVGTPATPGFCIGGIQSLNGERTPLSPKWSLNGNARYEMPIGNDWKGYVGSDVSYRSKILFEGKNDPNEFQSAYAVVNFNAGFGPEDGRWTASVYLRNAFKEHFVSRVRDQLNVYQQINSYEALRRIGAQLEVKF